MASIMKKKCKVTRVLIILKHSLHEQSDTHSVCVNIRGNQLWYFISYPFLYVGNPSMSTNSSSLNSGTLLVIHVICRQSFHIDNFVLFRKTKTCTDPWIFKLWTCHSRRLGNNWQNNVYSWISRRYKVINNINNISYSSNAVVILRPRRFGKTLNLSMLESFLSLANKTKALYYKYQIGKHPEFIEKHCQKYPVVMIDMKDCKGNTWIEMKKSIWMAVLDMYEAHRNTLKNSSLPIVNFNSTKVPDDYMEYALGYVIKSLRVIHEKRVILLVDEYDTPLNHAFHKGFYEKAADFFGMHWKITMRTWRRHA